jgi:hypothetical protein
MALKVCPYRRVSIFIDGESGRGMFDKYMQHTSSDNSL